MSWTFSQNAFAYHPASEWEAAAPPVREERGRKRMQIIRRDDWLSLEQYAVLGDGRSAAVIGADGSVDWWAVPHLDSVPLFDRLLAGDRGGRLSITPSESFYGGAKVPSG